MENSFRFIVYGLNFKSFSVYDVYFYSLMNWSCQNKDYLILSLNNQEVGFILSQYNNPFSVLNRNGEFFEIAEP